jgi:hypothetical protein
MIHEPNAIDRLLAYGKGMGLEGPVGIRSAVGARFHKAADDQGRPEYVALANTDDVDLEDEVVDPRGADLSYISKNMKLFADHRYNAEDVVGSLRYINRYPNATDAKSQTAWQVRFKIARTEAGKTVQTIIEDTGGIGLSVGFLARDYGPPSSDEAKRYSKGGKQPRSIVRAWDWFELSATALPANKACQTQGVVYDEKHLGAIERLVTKGRISRAGAARVGLPIALERKTWRIVLPGPDHTVVIRKEPA